MPKDTHFLIPIPMLQPLSRLPYFEQSKCNQESMSPFLSSLPLLFCLFSCLLLFICLKKQSWTLLYKCILKHIKSLLYYNALYLCLPPQIFIRNGYCFKKIQISCLIQQVNHWPTMIKGFFYQRSFNWRSQRMNPEPCVCQMCILLLRCMVLPLQHCSTGKFIIMHILDYVRNISLPF